MAPDDPLFTFLSTRDVSCPICRYNLRGLAHAVCPECSAPLLLTVGSPNLQLGPFVLTIVSFSLAAGFDLVVSLLFAVMTVIFAQPGAPATWIGPAILLSILGSIGLACLGAIVLLVRRRFRWNRLSVRTQWRLAIATFLLVGLTHAVLGAILMSVMS